MMKQVAAGSAKQTQRKRAHSEMEKAVEDVEFAYTDFDMDEDFFAEGGFSKIYKAKLGGTLVAAKVFETKGLRMDKMSKMHKDFINEIAIMKAPSHP